MQYRSEGGAAVQGRRPIPRGSGEDEEEEDEEEEEEEEEG